MMDLSDEALREHAETRRAQVKRNNKLVKILSEEVGSVQGDGHESFHA